MKTIKASSILSCLLIFTFALSACSALAPAPTVVPTNTPAPTATVTLTPTNTPRPSPTPRPTKTPDMAATQKYNAFNTETQKYFGLGYLKTAEGTVKEIDDFYYEWAQLGWYSWQPLEMDASDFYISAHFAWDSAFKNADDSGCGIAFAIQPDKEHYSVFLDRNKVVFLDADKRYSYSRNVGKTRGNGKVKFSMPSEADFTLIVKDAYAYVLVDGEVIGEYTLAQSRTLRGDIGLSILSGTNKDYGTKCSMTNIHVWTPK
jgi:hypothetical protein